MSAMPRASLKTSPEREKSTNLVERKSPPRAAKRKRKEGGDQDLEATFVNSAKRKKSKQTRSSKSDEDYNVDLDRGLNLSIAKLDNRLLADYVAKQTKRFFADLSLVELDDRYISGMFW